MRIKKKRRNRVQGQFVVNSPGEIAFVGRREGRAVYKVSVLFLYFIPVNLPANS